MFAEYLPEPVLTHGFSVSVLFWVILQIMATTRQNPFYTKLAMILISLIALFYIAVLGKSVLVPLIFGLLFSVMLLPLANFFERKLHFPRSLAALLSVLLLVFSL